METCGSGEKQSMQTFLHSLDLTLVLQEGKAWTDCLIVFTPEDLIAFIVVFRGKKKKKDQKYV